MARNYSCNTRAQSDPVHNTAVSRDAARDAVQSRLTIGQQYRLKSVKNTEHDKPVDAVCTLLEMGRNILIFKHRGGLREAFTYQEILKQIQEGDFI